MRYDEYLQSDEWKARRAQARQRAKNRCEHCGGPPDHVHHVRYPKNFKDDVLENLIVVCESCHMKHHGIRGKEMNSPQILRFMGRISSMPEIINLNDRLGRLSQTVQHRIAKRNERLRSAHADKQARKAKDWQTVKDHHPDVAQFIGDVGKVFGPLSSVTVTDNSGDVLLDSRRYE